jgi:uncharacterized membrane protein (UPF0127 family)
MDMREMHRNLQGGDVSMSIRVLWLTLLAFALASNMAIANTGFPTLQLLAGKQRIEVEVASTPGLRDLGLMNRSSLPVNRGMLFVFPEAHRHCMWMQNTPLPLSVAFIDDNDTIVNITDMQPNSETYHCADRPVHYVLEMNNGWFAEKKLGPGAMIKGLSKAPRGR